MLVLRNLTVVILIGAIQFGSLGFLVNKHYCKGRLDEVSVLLASQGCKKELSLLERLLKRKDDCMQLPHSNGLAKSDCCDFTSDFSLISVFHEVVLDIQLFDISLVNCDLASINLPRSLVQSLKTIEVLRPPPQSEICVYKRHCSFLI